MKILVTGGAGFIGSNIVDEYIQLGHDVVIIDDLSSGKREFINAKARLYEADIRKKSEINVIFKKERPEIINHQAAQISVRNSVENPQFDADINILGFLNIIEAGKTVGVKKVLFASSGGAIYGDANTIPTPEDYEPKIPLSPYGITKFASELYLQFYHTNFSIPFIALRYSNVYGPRQNPDGEAGVVAIFAKKIIKNESPTINGDGKQTRDYVYVGDVVNANAKALSINFSGGVNIATGKETSVIEIYNSLAKLKSEKISPIFGPAKKGEQKRSCLSIEKAKKEIGWKPEIDIISGLHKTFEYFQNIK